jgi:starvation-inducible DNA-binding protein
MEEFRLYANKTVKALNDATIVSRLAHWNVRGSSFYEAHLLFERVYKELAEFQDGLSESLRTFGYSPDFAQFSGPGISVKNYNCQFLAGLTLDYVMSLSATLQMFFEFLEDLEGDPSLIGISNHIQNISDGTLTLMYLLQSFLGE